MPFFRSARRRRQCRTLGPRALVERQSRRIVDMQLNRLSCILAVPLVIGAGARAWALVAGGGPAKSDCYAEWQVTNPTLSGKTSISCVDGDTNCDADGVADGQCTFNVSICLFETDTALSQCTPQTVTAVTPSAKVKPKGTPAVSPPTPPAPPASAAVCRNPTPNLPTARQGNEPPERP